MRKISSKSRLMAGSVSAIALMTCYPHTADAQVIEEITVTATKREATIQEVPLAITALTGDFTRETNLNDVKDVINWTPGITGNTSDSFIDGVSVRGILTNDFGVGGDPSVGFFKNNLYQGRTGVVNSSLYDMNRVEALRGPQGFLFGRGTVGGAISMHTQRPMLDENSSYIELDGGERAHFVGEGAVNFSNSDQFAVRIAGYYSHEDGYVENIARPDDPKLLRHEKYAVRGSALYDNGTVDAFLTLEYENRDGDGSVYQPLPGTILDNANAIFEDQGVPLFEPGTGRDTNSGLGVGFGFGRPEDDSQIFRLGFEVNVDAGPVTITSISGFTTHDYLYIEDFDGLPTQGFEYQQDQTGDYFQTELRAVSNTDSRLSWYAGVSYYREKIDTTFIQQVGEKVFCDYYFGGYYPSADYYYSGFDYCAAYYSGLVTDYPYADQYPPGYYDYPYYVDPSLLTDERGNFTGIFTETNRVRGTYQGWAGYVNLNYAVTDKLDVEAGLRYSYDRKNFSNFPVPDGDLFAFNFVIYPSEAIVDTKSWDDFTPRFIIRYRPNDDWTLFGSVTRGYKSGGFGSFSFETRTPEVPEPDFGATGLTNAEIRPSDFDKETVWSYEAGVKGRSSDRRLRFDANVFYYEYKNLQLLVPGPGASTIVDNVGNVRGYGLEGSANWVLNDYISVAVTGALTDTKARNAQDACPSEDPEACEGTGLGHVPAFSGSARIIGRFPVRGGQIRGTFEMFGQTDVGALGFSVDPDELIKGYAELALRLSYRSDTGWAITGYVENLTNVTYLEGIFNGEGMFAPAAFNPSRPRTFGVRLYAPFGGK